MVVSPAVLVCNNVPPVEALYHLKVPAVELFAANTTAPAPQVEPAVTVGADGMAFTVAVTALRVVLSQPTLFVRLT